MRIYEIKREKGPVNPIDIEICDNGKFADMAYFFDRRDVLTDIAELRGKWLGGKTIPNEDIVSFINVDRSLAETKDFWRNYYEVFAIAKKYRLGNTFIRPITAAVLSGKVTGVDYTTSLSESQIRNLPEDLQLDEQVTYTSRQIRKIDLKNIRKDDKALSAVKQHRIWFWEYQEMGYKKIAKLRGESVETIKSGIRYYKKYLNTYYKGV